MTVVIYIGRHGAGAYQYQYCLITASGALSRKKGLSVISPDLSSPKFSFTRITNSLSRYSRLWLKGRSLAVEYSRERAHERAASRSNETSSLSSVWLVMQDPGQSHPALASATGSLPGRGH